MIRAVAFDVMDTLVTDPFRAALEAATGLPVTELLARRDPAAYPAFERGEIDEAAYWSHFEAAGISVDPDRFHAVRRAGIAWVVGMASLLDELGGAVLRVAATNYPHWVEDLAAVHLDGRIDLVVASCHLGVRKPDPAFYRHLLDRVGAEPHEVLFVDDRDVNVEAARQAGLDAQQFVDAASLREWLTERGVATPARS